MKIKLTHLIIASLMLLGVVFSSAGNVFSATSLLKTSDRNTNTTSASGFDEDQITKKNYNGVTTFEKYDPEKHDYELTTLFDLEIDVVRINSETVEVTMRNTSQTVVNDQFWMTFFVAAPNNSNGLDGFYWQNKYTIPGPQSETTVQFSSAEIGYLSANQWKFRAFSYVVPGDTNLSNNSDSVCRDEGNCPPNY